MSLRSWTVRFVCFAAPLVAFAGVAASGGGCANSYDPEATTKVLAPDYDIYATYLDTFINRRCGTLDCHGATGRAFRHYGNLGLRRLEGKPDEFTGDAGGEAGAPRRAGLGVTTPDEIRANYAGIIALEPEVISRLVALNGNFDAEDARARDWMFLRKALGRPLGATGGSLGERHKGGNVLRQNDDGYRCIVLWLRAPRKPASWKEPSDGGAGGDGGGGASAGTRANPVTSEEKEYVEYLNAFELRCVTQLAGYQ